MDLEIKTQGKYEFQAAGPFQPRMDNGAQRRDKETGLPLWAVSVVVWNVDDGDNRTAETILITVATENPPLLDQMEFVEVTSLRAVPWVPNNGSKSVRIAYRAESVTPVKASMPVKSAS